VYEPAPSSAATAAPGIQPGRKIGKYEILRHMASGGMAEIYLARATGIENFEKYVVLKRILPAISRDPEVIRMLLDEARIAATLHHSNIVQVFDIGQIDGEYFICMEYLHGKNVAALAAALQRRGARLDEDSALSIVTGVCAGLQYAHDKVDDQGSPLGIVHRDVSPHNVVITQDGGVKLVDFGLVKVGSRRSESSSGTLKGKLAYMSPEQCRARPLDRRSDVFALSIMLWELTTGERLYTGECDYDFLCAILENNARLPSSVVPDYPPALEAIVMKGLARDPDARWPSAEAMQVELEEYCRDRRLKVSPITLRRTMQDVFGDELRASMTTGIVVEADVSLGLGSIYGGRHMTEPAIPRPSRTTAPRQVAEIEAVTPRSSRWYLRGGIAVAACALAVAAYLVTRSAAPPPPPAPENAAREAAPAPASAPVTSPGPIGDPAAAAVPPSESSTATSELATASADITSSTTPTKTSTSTKTSPSSKTVKTKRPARPAAPVTKQRKPVADHDSLFPE